MNQLWIIPLLVLGTLGSGSGGSMSGLQTSFVVLSDPHYFEPSLGITGKAFDTCLKQEGKLIRESAELVHEAIEATLASGVELALIPGDLTKDGALDSHLGLVDHLGRLTEQGIKVFVVPGNHDVNSTRAFSYQGDSAVRVSHVTPQQFSQLYGPYGYDQALFRDSFSLSYIAEPVDGLWIVGLDACIYSPEDSNHYPQTGGALRPETKKWLEHILLSEDAVSKMKVALVHHGILEHFKSQKKHFDNYVVKDQRKVSRWMAGLGVSTVFTGHFHANDVTLRKWKDGSFLFDIETGSLVTYPCPFRKISLKGDRMEIETQYIRSIPSRQEGLREYARHSVRDGAAEVAEKTMLRFRLNPDDAGNIALQLGDLFADHCAGDEIPKNPSMDMRGISLWGRFLVLFRKDLISGLSKDLPPADNSLGIHLPTGAYD